MNHNIRGLEILCLLTSPCISQDELGHAAGTKEPPVSGARHTAFVFHCLVPLMFGFWSGRAHRAWRPAEGIEDSPWSLTAWRSTPHPPFFCSVTLEID